MGSLSTSSNINRYLSSTPSVADYYTHNKLPVVDTITTTGPQPSSTPERYLGLQPEEFRDVDAGHSVVVIGAGDVFTRFVHAPLQHRGAKIYVYDPKLAAIEDDPSEMEGGKTAAEKLAALGLADVHVLKSLNDAPDDVDFAISLTPPACHLADIAWAQERRLPIMVEKPLVADMGQFTTFNNMAVNLQAPIYCMDWMVAHALPLAAVIAQAKDKKVPFADAVTYTDVQNFAKFDFGTITKIECSRIKEMKPGTPSEVEFMKRERPAVYRGGILSDMGTHVFAALAALGFKPDEVGDVILGHSEGQKDFGVYRRLGDASADDSIPAWYAQVRMRSKFGNRNIPTTVEVAKDGLINDSHFTLTDKHGNKLRWEFGYGTEGKAALNKVTLYDRKGRVLATAESQIDPYAFMVAEAANFFEQQKSSPRQMALYAQEQRGAATVVEAAASKGRNNRRSGQVILQRALWKKRRKWRWGLPSRHKSAPVAQSSELVL